MNGYDTYDYGARGYYPAIGRFTTVDLLAERNYSVSPYAYCSGNPVNRIDPDGMQETLPYDAYKAYRLYRAYRAARITATAGRAFVLGKFGVEYYNDQQMKQRANEVSSSLIQRANLIEEHNQKAKATTPEQRGEQKRRDERSRQEDAKIAKTHNNIVNNNVGTPTPDGSPDPKNTPDNVTIGTLIAVGVGIAAALRDMNPNNQLKTIPTPELPKPAPPKIEPPKIFPLQPKTQAQ